MEGLSKMEVFKKLVDKVLCFDIGIVDFEGKYFHVLHDNDYNPQRRDELMEMRKNAISELLNLDPDQAKRQVQRLKNIFEEIDSSFWKLVEEDGPETAFEYFGKICYANNINLRYGSAGFATITRNFCSDIQDEITDKLRIIDNLSNALLSVNGDLEPLPISKYVLGYNPDEVKVSNKTRMDVPIILWNRVLTEGQTISPSNQKLEIKKISTDVKDFSWFLNSNGSQIIEKLTTYYQGAKPVELFAMVFALIEMDLIKEDKKNLKKVTLKDISNALQLTFKTPISEQSASNNIG
jgi:hypothetical protein